MEAFAEKLPVVATNTGGISDVVHSDQTGILISEKNEEDIRNAIEKILNCDEYKKAIVDNAYSKVQEYDYSAIAVKYYKLIEEKVIDE